MNMYRKKKILPQNQTQGGIRSRNDSASTLGNGRIQPPKNISATMAEITMMLAYSARKNSANRIPLYSVWNPPVSSVSASGRSNGTRFVSASPPMNTRTAATGWTKKNQRPVSRCASTMPTRLSVPAVRMTLTSVMVIAIS